MVAINWLNETQEVNRDHAVVCLGLTLVFFFTSDDFIYTSKIIKGV